MFKERKTKFALLSLLSALVVASTAFVGVSIYAQTDDGELTTFEEEAIASGEEFEDTMSNATSDDNATEDSDTSVADVQSLLDGLVVCNLGTAEVSGETEVASFDEGTTPTVSVTVMSETEVAALAANETETSSEDGETSTASAECVLVGEDESSGNATGEANATSTSNATSMGNMTDGDNATSTSTFEESDSTSAANTPDSDREILVIEGQDFAPGQVVLMFSENALLGIDDVDHSGEIEAKIPMPDSGETAVAGNDTAGLELRFLESGTQRTATFEFDGETLTAAEDGDIEAEGGEGVEEDREATMPLPMPDSSDNATSTNSTSTTNSTNATMQ